MTIRETELRFTIAPSLYDGGWRANDIEGLKECYDFSEEEAKIVAEEMARIEGDE